MGFLISHTISKPYSRSTGRQIYAHTHHRIMNVSAGKLFCFCFDSIFSEPSTHTLTHLHADTGDILSCWLKAKDTHSHNYPCEVCVVQSHVTHTGACLHFEDKDVEVYTRFMNVVRRSYVLTWCSYTCMAHDHIWPRFFNSCHTHQTCSTCGIIGEHAA